MRPGADAPPPRLPAVLDPMERPRLLRPLSMGPATQTWLARSGRRAVVARIHSPWKAGSPWPPPPDPASLRAIGHPRIASLLAAFVDVDGTAWHVFGRTPGRSLRERLREGPLDVDAWRVLLSDAARGLDWLHRRCPIAPRLHGDVSPGNLLVTTSGHGRWLDVRADAIEPAGTPLDPIVGTLPYLAPEVLCGTVPRPSSEVFSLALVAVVAAGVPLPWRQAATPREARDGHLRVPPVRLADRVPVPCVALLAAMLDPDPDRRPTARQVVSGLRAPGSRRPA